MKFKVICKLPSEVIIVGLILAAIGIVVGCVLLVQVIITMYGATIVSFTENNATMVAVAITCLMWFLAAWSLEGHAKKEDERDIVMGMGTLIALVAAALTGLAFGTPNPNQYAMPLPNFTVLGIVFALQLVSMLAGWLGHWCYRCVRIERDAPAGGT